MAPIPAYVSRRIESPALFETMTRIARHIAKRFPTVDAEDLHQECWLQLLHCSKELYGDGFSYFYTVCKRVAFDMAKEQRPPTTLLLDGERPTYENPAKTRHYEGLKTKAREAGVNYSTFRNRLARGWSMDEALGQPAFPETLKDRATKAGVPYKTVLDRIARGWTEAEALKPAKWQRRKDPESIKQIAARAGVAYKRLLRRVNQGVPVAEALARLSA